MIQLSFQPAFDPFHAVYRILRLFPVIHRFDSLHHNQVRILDYYVLFPHRLSGIRFMPRHRKCKSLGNKYNERKPYGEQPEDRALFNRMEPMQTAALQTLATRRFIEPDELLAGRVKVTSIPLPKELGERITAANNEDTALLDCLAVLASEYTLAGQDGLKDRTGLLEYRYDTV